MKDTFGNRLHNREVSDSAVRSKSYRKLYGDRQLIDELDIVNELDGHSGCVNALSWSKSGNLLASGSDDQHLNIHSYQPDNSTSQFRLATTVATGHSQNIFSVKFMPHSNDRTVITAAGDSEVRVFDLEYAGSAREASAHSSIAAQGRRSRRSNLYDGVRYLTDGDTDSRVYRSHGDRVKRIVTESSPYLFLTCAEDGEVRQWDLRQPSSAYPAPRSGRYSTTEDHALPPPLISYKPYQIDLNTISCSASQPHYIALGGAHLHAFLHDRRMTGRDRLREAGKVGGRRRSAAEEDQMNEATRCVRKFAPKGQQKMGRSESGHITACKISDARPNEMIVSWSGDHIYSFDLVRSPDADAEDSLSPLTSTPKSNGDRKRKRLVTNSQTSLSQAARRSSRQRTEDGAPDGQDTALRIRYQNGQSEDIPLSRDVQSERQPQTPLTLREREAQRIAKATVKIRSSLFASQEEERDPAAQFTSTLGQTAGILSDIDDTMREWRYPMEPSQHMVAVQQTLRRNRESTRRLVQAAGTLARVLGGKLQTPSGTSPLIASFTSVEARSNDLQPTQKEQFGYDFLKAVLLWLESGVGRLIEGFTRPVEMLPNVKAASRLPIPESEASTEAINEYLIPYLLRMATDKPVVNVEINRFEVDDNRQLFASELAAVHAFAAAVKIPFADLSSAVLMAEGDDSIQAQDRQTAMKYWGLKVSRGVLLNAAEGVNFVFVSRAFGGPGRVVREVVAEDASMQNVENEEEGEAVQGVDMVDGNGDAVDGANAEDLADVLKDANTIPDETTEAGSEDANESTGLLEEDRSQYILVDDEEADDDDEHVEDSEDEEPEESDSDDEEDGVPNLGLPRFMYNSSAHSRRNLRHKVAANVPCTSSTRCFRGHCNIRTVKDVNYFGLNDEYVVSGSDDGNFFIWDAKTSELVNVLEGDGETVNVIQGHPYETMLAVSGIDHTIKIFSPDARARQNARLGQQGISAIDSSTFSSLAWPARLGRRHRDRTSESAATLSPDSAAREEEENEDYVAPNGLSSRKRMQDHYRITAQNDTQRQGGNSDRYVTRAMLAELGRRIQEHRANGGTGGIEMETEDEDGERHTIVLGEDCAMQ